MVTTAALAGIGATAIANPAAPTLEEFEAVLARHDSATLALEEWCALRGLAEPALVTATPLPAQGDRPPAWIRSLLTPAPGQRRDEADGHARHEPFAMRHVQLACGAKVLSVAWNWYVPARLTPAMNAALRRGDTPFGKVVAPLRFRRKPLTTVAGPAENCPADTISTHRAMLMLPDGRPLAYLVECYTAANLTP